MVLLFTGCFLFISADEHRARVAALSDSGDSGTPTDSGDTDDSGDSGDTDDPCPYIGSLDGPISIEIDMVGESECIGELEVNIDAACALIGEGSCGFTTVAIADLEINIVGQLTGSQATGYVRIGESLKDTWTGQMLSSDHDLQLEGSFSGTIEIAKVERDYDGEFDLD